MKLHRLYALILRHYYLAKVNITRITDLFFWPLLDILIWGITAKFIASSSVEFPNLILVMLSGVVLWSLVYRGQNEIAVGLLEELWNRNLVNIFTTPFKITEWMMSMVIISITKSIASFIFCIIVAFLLYDISILETGFMLAIFVLLLQLVAWSFGMFVSGVIYMWGTKVEIFAWSMVAILAPLSAIYYPVTILPIWAQKIAYFLPTMHVFESMRNYVLYGTIDWNALLFSFVLGFFYLIISILFVKFSFNKLLDKGLLSFH